MNITRWLWEFFTAPVSVPRWVAIVGGITMALLLLESLFFLVMGSVAYYSRQQQKLEDK